MAKVTTNPNGKLKTVKITKGGWENCSKSPSVLAEVELKRKCTQNRFGRSEQECQLEHSTIFTIRRYQIL